MKSMDSSNAVGGPRMNSFASGLQMPSYMSQTNDLMSSSDMKSKMNAQQPGMNSMMGKSSNFMQFPQQQQQRFHQPIPSSSPSFPQQPQPQGNWGQATGQGVDAMNQNGTALWQKNLLPGNDQQQQMFGGGDMRSY